jgi:hypothetical protein
VRFVGCAEDGLRLGRLVGPVDAGHIHRRNQHAFRVAERDRGAFLDLVRERRGHVERDRHRPNYSGREARLCEDGAIVLFPEEAFER